jgi:hypothetical protein
MQFTIVQQLPCTVTAFFDLLEQDVLEEKVRASSSSRRDPDGKSWHEGVLTRHTRIRPSRELPRLIAKLLGPEGLSYRQTVHTCRDAGENRWGLHVDRVGERVLIRGVERPEPFGDGLRLVIESTVEVQLPVLGGRVEAGVRKEIERVFERRRQLIIELLRRS